MSIAFKEWSLVCEALQSGATSLVLRKGGIAEGRAGFQWKHDAFFLLPTHYHAQIGQVRGATELPPHDPSVHCVRVFAKIEFHTVLTDWDVVAGLFPYHVWTEEVLRDRFDYTGERAISLAYLRIFSLDQPYRFPDAPSYGGCRSWVTIPDPPTGTTMSPVLDENSNAARRRSLEEILHQPLPT